MKRSRISIVCSFFLIALLAGIIGLDLVGVFNNSDVPFLLSFIVYFMVILIQRSSSRLTFVISLLCLILMGLSYIPTADGHITERFGEWFYIFFVFGLIQYALEVFHEKK